MRELIHYATIHDMPHALIPKRGRARAKVASYHELLAGFYTDLAVQLLDQHEQHPFHRVYQEGYTGERNIEDSSAAVHLPAICLQGFGAQIMVTEHSALNLLGLMLGKDFVPVSEALKTKPLEEVLALLSAEHVPEFRALFTDFFQGLEYGDIMAAREHWIGRNIASTLQEGEKGVLFLGKGHKPDNIQRYLEGVKYTYIDLFPIIK